MTPPGQAWRMTFATWVSSVITAVVGVVEFVILSIAKLGRWLWDRANF